MSIFEDLTKVEQYFEPVVAWRAWIVGAMEDNFFRLYSVNRVGYKPNEDKDKKRRIRWPYMQPLKAICRKADDHNSPHDECTCGIYGAAVFHEAWAYVFENQELMPDCQPIIGTAYYWGDAIEYSAGFRASRAYPKELWIPKMEWCTSKIERERISSALMDAYRIPVHLISDYHEIEDWQHIYSDQLETLPDFALNI